MQTKANKPWLVTFASFIIGACIGAALVLSNQPQPVQITTSSQAKCAIKHGQDTHITKCQILRTDLAYIEYQW